MINQAAAFSNLISNKFVFVDANVQDVDALIFDIGSDFSVHLLDRTQDGVHQITEVIQRKISLSNWEDTLQNSDLSVSSDIDIYIVAHGDSGKIYLGNSEFSLDTIEHYAEDLDEWFGVNQGKISIYSCNVADGNNGEEFVTQLSHITGATIYASTQKVGNRQKGGTWTLDTVVLPSHRHISIVAQKMDDNQCLFSSSVRASYAGILMSDPTLDLDSTDSVTTIATDNFENSSNNGGSGWLAAWERSNSNKVIFTDNTLRVRDPDRKAEASRRVDLSGVNNPTISLDYATKNLDASGSVPDTFIFEYSADNGSSWTTLESFIGDSSGSKTYSLGSTQGSADTIFRVGFVDGKGGNGEYFSIDNLTISGTPLGSTIDYATGDPAVAIAPNNSLANLTSVTSATITLTNAAVEDVLAFNASLPSGISASSYDSSSGVVTLTNSNSATVGDFQTAIAQLTFYSQSLEASDRMIELSVTDGSNTTNTAISIIEIDVPDPPQIDLSDSIALVFPTDPTLESGSPTTGVGKTVRYSNVGVTDSGNMLDMLATIMSVTGNDVEFEGGEGDGNDFKLSLSPDGNTGAVTAVIQYRFVETGTNSLLDIPELEFVVQDLDNGDFFQETIQTSDISGFTLDAPGLTTVNQMESGGIHSFGGTIDNNSATSSTAATQLLFNTISSFQVTYTSDFKRTGSSSGYVHNGDGTFVFTNPNTTVVNDAAFNYINVFTEGDNPVNVADVSNADVNDFGEGDINKLTIVVDPNTVKEGNQEIISIGSTDFLLDTDVTTPVQITIGNTTFNVIYDKATGTFTITDSGNGLMPENDLDSLIQVIKYENTSTDPTPGNRTLTFTVIDDTGKTSNEAVSTITVIPVDDPIAPAIIVAITEDGNNDGTITSSEFNGDIDAIVTLPATTQVGDILVVTDQNNTPVLSRPITQTDIDNGVEVILPNPGDGGTVSIKATVTDSQGQSVNATDTATLDLAPPAITVEITEDGNNDSTITSTELNGDINAKVTLPTSTQVGDNLVVTDQDNTTVLSRPITQTDIDNGVEVILPNPGDGGTVSIKATVTDNQGQSVKATDAATLGLPNPTITLDSNITADDIIDASEAGQTILITGTVGGDAKVDDIVTLTINTKSFTGKVEDNNGTLSFSIDVPGSDLVNDDDAIIDASITTSDAAGNQGSATDDESYSINLASPDPQPQPSTPTPSPTLQTNPSVTPQPSTPDTIDKISTPSSSDSLDSDGDGIPDSTDTDDDNDGILDTIEENIDTDGDGIPNSLDQDSDNDGIPDAIESSGDNLDTDNDGIPDYQDLDSDNDGIPDVIEAGGTDPDQDGIIGRGIPIDSDGDGWADEVDSSTGGTPVPIYDLDGDLIPDYQDLDSDNDGVFDLIERGGLLDLDNNGRADGGDSDGDGLLDIIDTGNGSFGSGNGAIDTPQDKDGNGIPDFRELPKSFGHNGSDGSDDIKGTKGNDVLNGFSDLDFLNGGLGHDIINGGSQKDVLIGGPGNDALNGGTNDDRLLGKKGKDLINGGSGHDLLLGHSGNDILNGGEGNDRIIGGRGRDILNGGDGKDKLLGRQKKDRLNGGDGDDVLVGGHGKDVLTGGEGRDKFRYLKTNEFGDMITDFQIIKDLIDLRRVRGIDSMRSLNFFQRGDRAIIKAWMSNRFKTVATLENIDINDLNRSHFKF
ncbi:MAG: DUF4347 domain-containing protein [Cyanobacteria bacterium P01_F01_bin.150]